MTDATGPAANGTPAGQDQHQDDASDLIFTKLATHWLEARDTIESFANKYLAPANRENTVTTAELAQDTMVLGVRMGSLWLSGLGLVVEEGGRLARRAANKPAAQDGPETTGS